MQEAVSTCRAAIYVRLSVEDSHTHSASIETQQMIIAQFLERNPDIQVYDTYIDNGTSGTTFHRPAFQKMLSDIESGFVNCVIVKDLSRLGRNTIDTGYYIEQYFRLRNVRFIAVNENFDTAAPEDAHSGIIIPLRNMINEAYALDIGRKIKAQQRQAMKDGKFIGSRTPYGYLKAPDDCHQLIIDHVAAPVVQKMFQWASEGIGLNTITVRLNEAGYLPPSHYKNTQGIITHENLIGNGNWNTRTVARILHAQVYTGDLVQGRTKIVDHQQVEVSEMEWTVVHDTHEAIISHKLFEAVQKKLDETAQHCKEREVQAYSPNILKGKIFCAHCGGSLKGIDGIDELGVVSGQGNAVSLKQVDVCDGAVHLGAHGQPADGASRLLVGVEVAGIEGTRHLGGAQACQVIGQRGCIVGGEAAAVAVARGGIVVVGAACGQGRHGCQCAGSLQE